MIDAEIISSIKRGKLAVFCGAGISYNSGLPIVKDFSQFLFSTLKVKPHLINSILTSNLPFEALAEIIIEECNSTEFLKIYAKGKPNTNHEFLAKLGKQQKIKLIVTTNFDTLIEKAFENEGLKKGKDYLVYYKEQNFKDIPWNSNKILLIKIHGTISQKKDMAVTLKQVTKSPLTKDRKRIIDYLFSTGRHNAVLVLGYSCSDIFDITPQIQSLERELKKVWLINHVKYSPVRVSSLYHKKGKHPFFEFKDAKAIRTDTDLLVEKLWSKLLLPGYSFTCTRDSQWKVQLKDWLQEKVLPTPAYKSITGKVMYSISDYQKALAYFKSALKRSKTGLEKALHYSNIGIVYKELGKNEISISYHLKAAALSKRHRKWTRYTASLNNLAYTYRFFGDIDSAFIYQNESLGMAIKLKDERLQAINYNNLGILYGHIKDHKTAIFNFEKALSLMHKIGFKQWEASTLTNIGIVLNRLGKCTEAISFHKDSLEVARNIGSKQEECQALGNMGQTYFKMKKFNPAITNLKAAIILSREINNRVSEYQQTKALSNLYKAIGKPSSYSYYKGLAEKVKRSTDWMKMKK